MFTLQRVKKDRSFRGDVKNDVKCSSCENLIDQFITIDVESKLRNVSTKARINEINKKIKNLNQESLIREATNGKNISSNP